MKISADLGGCYPPLPSASMDNTLLDLNLQNSSYPTQSHSIIAKNYCFQTTEIKESGGSFSDNYYWYSGIARKNIDLIACTLACTSARYRCFTRKWSWEASKETRTRGLVASTSLLPALSLVQTLNSSVPEKRLLILKPRYFQTFSHFPLGLRNSGIQLYTRNLRPVWFSCN